MRMFRYITKACSGNSDELRNRPFYGSPAGSPIPDVIYWRKVTFSSELFPECEFNPMTILAEYDEPFQKPGGKDDVLSGERLCA
jgi:hypothetical protein